MEKGEKGSGILCGLGGRDKSRGELMSVRESRPGRLSGSGANGELPISSR